MAFLRSVPPPPAAGTIRGEKVVLRPPTMADYQQWSMLRAESRKFLAPWEPIWPADELSRLGYRRRIKRYQREMREGSGYPFFVFSADGVALLGGLTLSQIQRGVTQSGALGYWMGERHANRGYMSDAVRTLVSYTFDSLRLHRIEAACLAHNAASIRLLEKVGFSREGYARSYLCIDGRWQDHLLYAMVNDDPRR
ncbi:MAG: GNAT family N-acetyltransferase [Bauldia sp.]|nr:GNAT family N-acetyltransferase [Bauldia sp.]